MRVAETPGGPQAVRTPLALVSPRRGKPPRHLADLTNEERVAAVAQMGEPAFRATQLSMHYFGHLTDDPADMSDLPARIREEVVASLLPALVTPVRTITADAGTTVKTLWSLHDLSLIHI